jgi:replicative DNA helicase
MNDFRDSRIEQLRVPPASIQAEQAVIGGVMLAPNAYHLVSDLLSEDDFYRRDHRLIWRAICDCADAKPPKPYDAVTLGEWFESQGMAEMVAGGAYLVELASNTPSAANVVAYAEIVRDKAMLRQLIEFGTDAVNSGFDPQRRDSAEIISELSARFAELQPKSRGGFVSVRDAARGWIDRIQRRYNEKERVTGIPTPWTEFNHATRGLQPATLYLFAGRPSMGKSVVANSIAACAALRGKRVALFSLEASQMSVLDRCISNIGDIPYDWFHAPATYDDETFMPRASAALSDLLKSGLIIDDTAAITCRQFEAKARREHLKAPLDLIVVDHIHDFKINPTRARFEIGDIAQAGKTLAKEFKIPVAMFAQLNRGVEGRTDGAKRPRMSDLRESGELEQKADVITLLHREDYYNAETPLKGVLEFILAKGRDMETGTKYMHHRFDRMRIEDWDGPIPNAKIGGAQPQGRGLGEF